jgi:hypothetical protein
VIQLSRMPAPVMLSKTRRLFLVFGLLATAQESYRTNVLK